MCVCVCVFIEMVSHHHSISVLVRTDNSTDVRTYFSDQNSILNLAIKYTVLIFLTILGEYYSPTVWSRCAQCGVGTEAN